MDDGMVATRTRLWTTAAIAMSLPLLVVLCSTLLTSPYPLSEAVGLFEDVAERPISEFFNPTTSYYRPLFYVALSAIWHGAPSTGAALDCVRLLHIVPVTLLVFLFIWYLRPQTPIDAAVATVAVAVLIGSPGFLGNLELPLSYTIAAMPAALLVWMLLERDYRRWHGAAIVALTILAIGFKEQGLVVAAVVMAAWCMGARGAGRASVATVTAIAAGYVVFRLAYHDPSAPLFEQDVGLGFGSLSPGQAEARFGDFPLWIYGYNAAGTIANVLFAEPTEGVFRFVRALTRRDLQPWHVVYFLSSAIMTGLIIAWGTGALLRATDRTWSRESRLFVAAIVAVGACGALSFNYSRDRLGGMAVVFYALASFFAFRGAAARAARASRPIAAIAGAALFLLAAAWQCRAIYTIEFTRQRAVNSHREWITDLARRRAEFATRPAYLRIMEDMTGQGTAHVPVQRTRYPRWMLQLLGEY